MAIILYSFGPGLFLKVLCPRGACSLTACLATVFLLEVEPWLRPAAESGFLWSRTLAGAAMAVLLVTLAGKNFLSAIRRTVWKIIRPHERADRQAPLKPSVLILGATAGALISLTFAAVSGASAMPLWPLYDGALVSEPFSNWRVQRLSARFLPLALLTWGIKRMRGH